MRRGEASGSDAKLVGTGGKRRANEDGGNDGLAPHGTRSELRKQLGGQGSDNAEGRTHCTKNAAKVGNGTGKEVRDERAGSKLPPWATSISRVDGTEREGSGDAATKSAETETLKPTFTASELQRSGTSSNSLPLGVSAVIEAHAPELGSRFPRLHICCLEWVVLVAFIRLIISLKHSVSTLRDAALCLYCALVPASANR